MSSDRFTGVRQRIRLGIRWGLLYAGGFSVLAAILVLVRTDLGSSAAIAGAGRAMLVVVPIYLAGGLLSGATVSVLLPVARRSVVGAMLVGFVGAVPVFAIVALAMAKPGMWWPAGPVLIAMCSLAFGPAAGYIIWRDEIGQVSLRRPEGHQ